MERPEDPLAEKQRKNTATGWMHWTAVIVGLPLVYLLTLPPLMTLAYAKGTPSVMMNAYAAPGEWLYFHPLMYDHVINYWAWWDEALREKKKP